MYFSSYEQVFDDDVLECSEFNITEFFNNVAESLHKSEQDISLYDAAKPSFH